jgi:hypothetical protein
MKTRTLQRLFCQKWLGPDKIDRGKDGSDARHDRTPPTSDQRAFPMKESEAKGRAYASQMPVQGGKALYKV